MWLLKTLWEASRKSGPLFLGFYFSNLPRYLLFQPYTLPLLRLFQISKASSCSEFEAEEREVTSLCTEDPSQFFPEPILS